MQAVVVPKVVTQAQQEELVARVLASATFRKSRRLSDFLLFVCKRYQAGDLGSIQEHRIGVEVFERAEGYHVGEDSIVRSQARFLRQRLEEYFAGDGIGEPVVLTIPKGSYVPSFDYRVVAAEPLPLPPVVLPAPVEAPPARTAWGIWAGVAVVALLALVFAVKAFVAHREPRSSQLETRFWNSFFDPRRPQMIVPGDSSLVMMEQMIGKPVPLRDYMSRKYLEDPAPAGLDAAWQIAKSSQYTNLADLNLVARLQQLAQVREGKVQIRYARDVNLKELKESNALLIGGTRANPWTELFDNSTSFRVDYDWNSHRNLVVNRKPAAGEQELYTDELADGHHVAYGVISYLPSLDGDGSALLIRGTKKAGTEAAGDFLFTRDFGEILGKVETDHGPRHFEVLLSTGEINGDAHHTRVLCLHIVD